MRLPFLLALCAVATLLGCSSGPEKQWMKTGPYTSEEFKRDTAACTRDGDLDEACMRAKGWFAVQAERAEDRQQKKERPAYSIPRAQ
jgi:hypothetical protein